MANSKYSFNEMLLITKVKFMERLAKKLEKKLNASHICFDSKGHQPSVRFEAPNADKQSVYMVLQLIGFTNCNINFRLYGSNCTREQGNGKWEDLDVSINATPEDVLKSVWVRCYHHK